MGIIITILLGILVILEKEIANSINADEESKVELFIKHLTPTFREINAYIRDTIAFRCVANSSSLNLMIGGISLDMQDWQNRSKRNLCFENCSQGPPVCHYYTERYVVGCWKNEEDTTENIGCWIDTPKQEYICAFQISNTDYKQQFIN